MCVCVSIVVAVYQVAVTAEYIRFLDAGCPLHHGFLFRVSAKYFICITYN